MSVFNDQNFLEQAIESVLDQTFQDFEFIICNDCSTDNSENIILEMMQKDPRIVYIKNEKNLGLAASLNKCILKSTTPFLARMDSDDICFPNRLDVEYKYLIDNPYCAVVGSHSLIIDNQNNIIRESAKLKKDLLLKDCLQKSSLIHPSVMMRKEFIQKVGMYSVNPLTQRAEDYDLWCKLSSNGYKLNNLEDKLLYYREGVSGLKKRKYKFRIQEFRIKFYWNKKMKFLSSNFIYVIKPLIIGLIPVKIYKILKN